MADDRSRPDNHRANAGTDNDNPFISFRQYADAAISTLWRDVVGSPQTLSAPRKPHDNHAHDEGTKEPVPPKSWVEEFMESGVHEQKHPSTPASGAGKGGDDDDYEYDFEKWIQTWDRQRKAEEASKPKMYPYADENWNKVHHPARYLPFIPIPPEHESSEQPEALTWDGMFHGLMRFAGMSESQVDEFHAIADAISPCAEKSMSERWFDVHPYSPGYLERSQIGPKGELKDNAPPFLDAFEDLMRAERGEPMVQRPQRKRHLAHRTVPPSILNYCLRDHHMTRDFWAQTTHPLHFALDACRPIMLQYLPQTEAQRSAVDESIDPCLTSKLLRSMAPHVKSVFTTPEEFLERYHDRLEPDLQGPEHEQDYSAWGNREMEKEYIKAIARGQVGFIPLTVRPSHTPNSTSTPLWESPSTSPSESQSNEPPAALPCRLVSSSTTTHRTVDADGTVTTKVVLQKKHADGRIETTETVNKEAGEPLNGDDGAARKKGRGWFWA